MMQALELLQVLRLSENKGSQSVCPLIENFSNLVEGFDLEKISMLGYLAKLL